MSDEISGTPETTRMPYRGCQRAGAGAEV